MSKIWNKGFDADKAVLNFTVGKDRELDLRLAKQDIIGSLAHIKMLAEIGLMEREEEKILRTELQNILKDVEKANFSLDDDVEDIHSQIESMLIKRLG
ncbi:MAG: argininosuccinate lyase, partial [Dysgonamonadaceae bacterium]